MTIDGGTYRAITTHVFKEPNKENAGFAFARTGRTPHETRLIVREFLPLEDGDVLAADEISMSIDSHALAKALKHADTTDQCMIFVHSHPKGYADFSTADDRQEPALFKSAYNRNESEGPHASLVIPKEGGPRARVWLSDGRSVGVDRIRVIGSRFTFYDANSAFESPEYFDRQVLAFGANTQALLGTLHVAVVGAGGTGSAVTEQLIRLGVKELSLYDGQRLENSNVTRVFGSRVTDRGTLKVDILARLAHEIGLGTIVHTYPSHITDEKTAESLRDADLVFGCTDDEWGRSILNRLAYRYYIPVIDMGVKVSSLSGTIHSVAGRVTVLAPGTACLFCRERISVEQITAESNITSNPEGAEALRKEGYAPELPGRDPSVIPFTSSVAAQAICELFQRITGFMGNDRASSEVLLMFDQCEIRTNADRIDQRCGCANTKHVGLGDTRDYLGMLWA